MKIMAIALIVALCLAVLILSALLLYAERRRMDLEIRLEEKDDLIDFFHVDLMDSDDEEELE